MPYKQPSVELGVWFSIFFSLFLFALLSTYVCQRRHHRTANAVAFLSCILSYPNISILCGGYCVLFLPAVKLVEWISVAVARIYSVWGNRINSVQAFRTPSMYGFYAESIRMRAQNWIRPHFPGWDVTEWTLQSGPGERMMGDFSGF